MKIAIVTWEYCETQGISRCVSELTDRLASSAGEIHVFTTASDRPADPRVVVRLVPLRLRRWFYLAEWEFFFRVGAILRRERFDLVHLHFPAWYPAHVFSCHGVAPAGLRFFRKLPVEAGQDVPMSRMWKFYLQVPLHGYHLQNRRTLVSAVSEKVRQEIAVHYGRPGSEVEVVPNGVDLQRFHPSRAAECRSAVRRELGIAEDAFLLLFVGHRFGNKGGRYAVETLARLPERAVLLLVGADRPESIRDRRGVLPPLVRDRRVLFAGFERDVSRFYAASDALIFPSLYESFALVALEAMAAGLPVITAKTVGLGYDVLRDGENGFVVDLPWDIDGMAERASRLLADPALCARIGAEARKTAERYSWDRYAEATLALYGRVAGNSGGGAEGKRA